VNDVLFRGSHRQAVIALLQGCMTEHELMTYANVGNSSITQETACEIRRRWRFGERQCDLAMVYGVSPSTICQIVNHITHRERVIREETVRAHR